MGLGEGAPEVNRAHKNSDSDALRPKYEENNMHVLMQMKLLLKKRGSLYLIFAVCPEWKAAASVKEVVKKFSKPMQMTVDSCEEEVSITMACALIWKYNPLARCKTNSE